VKEIGPKKPIGYPSKRKQKLSRIYSITCMDFPPFCWIRDHKLSLGFFVWRECESDGTVFFIKEEEIKHQGFASTFEVFYTIVSNCVLYREGILQSCYFSTLYSVELFMSFVTF